MQTTPRWLIANWKMNGDAAAVRAWAFAVNQALAAQAAPLRAVFCPPAIYLGDAGAALPANARLMLGGQDCHREEKGAFTGETSAAMLADKGCRFVIVGHSECRRSGDCDATVRAKAQAALAAGLTPIICLGEAQADYDNAGTQAALDRQLAGLGALPAGGYLIAYEPLWAIGANRTPAPTEIQAAHRHIKSVLGSSATVLYGGSVHAGNAREILALPEVAGALIGGASLEIASMCALITGATTTR
ncbi:MAG: triose-phosphate isomerase [Alphaproteobacteria bacterium]|nr:triose-phosphate isomerase [Alphaproteobacteria bacterium]